MPEIRRLGEIIGDKENDMSAYSIMRSYLIECLKNRFSPELSISGADGSIEFDELLRRTIGTTINSDRVMDCLRGQIDEDELRRLIDKISQSKTEWNIAALEYGKAITICLANRFGNDFSLDSFERVDSPRVPMSTIVRAGLEKSTSIADVAGI